MLFFAKAMRFFSAGGFDAMVPCPKCKGPMMRARREGWVEEVVYPLTGRYPWICAFCKRRSVIRMRMPRRGTLIETNRGMWDSRYRT